MINDTVSFYVKRNKEWKNKVCTFRKIQFPLYMEQKTKIRTFYIK